MTDTDKEQARHYLTDFTNQITEKSKGHFYKCPLCGSGSSGERNSDGAFFIDPKGDGTRWTCFSCNEKGDIFDLVGLHFGLTDFKDQVQKVAELYGIQNGNTQGSNYPAPPKVKKREQAKLEQTGQRSPSAPLSGLAPPTQYSLYPQEQLKQAQAERGADYTQYIRESQERLENSPQAISYLQARGFHESLIKHFNLGYDPKKGIVLPYNRENAYYLTRSIEGKEYRKPKAEEAGPEPVFLAENLYTNPKEPCYVVESPFCALSIIQARSEAVAIGGSGEGKLIDLLKQYPTKKHLYLSLDNDEAGRKTTERLSEALTAIGQPYTVLNISETYKDPNEALTGNREAFYQAIQNAKDIAQKQKEEQKAQYRATQSARSQVQGFINGIAESVNTPFISTGFESLDSLLDGGLYEGLYIIGAISSLGKTTFTLQVADNIARKGDDVLFFSLEMARNEMIAKSISRETAQEVVNTGGDMRHAKTTRGISTGKRWGNYQEEEKKLIAKAVETYENYAENLFIYEGIGDIGIEEVTTTVQNHVAMTEKNPVVIIDYLQILAPYEPRATDKQNTDKAVLELKRLSRDLKIPVFAISSFNRDSYRQPVNMASFKESGAIEYSSDVLIGLQYEGMDDKSTDTKELMERNAAEAKEGRAVKVELKVLKNRNGAKGKALFDFYPMFNLFREVKYREEGKTARRVL